MEASKFRNVVSDYIEQNKDILQNIGLISGIIQSRYMKNILLMASFLTFWKAVDFSFNDKPMDFQLPFVLNLLRRIFVMVFLQQLQFY